MKVGNKFSNNIIFVDKKVIKLKIKLTDVRFLKLIYNNTSKESHVINADRLSHIPTKT